MVLDVPRVIRGIYARVAWHGLIKILGRANEKKLRLVGIDTEEMIRDLEVRAGRAKLKWWFVLRVSARNFVK